MPGAGGSFSWMQQIGGSTRAFWGSRGSRGGKSSGCLSVLAGGAEKRCSSPKFLVSYRCGADRAGQLSSAIHLKMDLEITAISACIDEIADCRTTAFDGGGEDLSDFVDQQNVAFFTYCARFSSGAYTGAEETLVGIYVTDSSNYPSIHDEIFNWLLFVQCFFIEVTAVEFI